MKPGLYILIDKVKVVMESMRKLPGKTVLVGVPASHNQHDGEGTGAEITNSQIGFMNEFGVPEMNIPARPHLVPGIRAVKGKVANYLRQAGEAATAGDSARVQRAMTAAGLVAVASVQNKITNGPFTPLADRTISARLARGRTGSKPLIDTGQYRRAITFTIRGPRG